MRWWLLSSLVLALAGSAFAEEHLRLATTTSTEQTGLLAAVLPRFEQRFHLEVDVIAVGSGKALKLAENGDVDVVLSHAPELEEAFVRAGFGVNRRELMYNDFVVVGPAADPARVRDAGGAVAAFKRLAEARATFISRGDESGTHQKEKELWKAAGITPAGTWYVSAGLGMGEVLLMTAERGGYTLADRGTYVTYRKRGDLGIVCEGDRLLFNPYTVIAVNLARHRRRSTSRRWSDRMATSPAGQRLIGTFEREGQVLFHPTAVPIER
jgi:tungstate transport system substrate-binding protein